MEAVNPQSRRGPDALCGRIFSRLWDAHGPSRWWPAEAPDAAGRRDEIIIGAVLTQNTSWLNVKKALAVLRAEKLCRLNKLARMEPEAIAPHIRSAGYFNLKARRLRSVADFFAPGGGDRFKTLNAMDDEPLREALLGVWGVGRETADSILLYALGRRSFVVDAYTLRVGRRHGFLAENDGYEVARSWFTRHAPADTQHYNEYHALLVWVGHHYCKPTPRCAECPLSRRDCFASPEAWKNLAERRTVDS